MHVKLDHPNLLKAREFFFHNLEKYLAIVLEYCPKGSLANFVGNFDQTKLKPIMKQIVEGVVYLHDNKVIHRDIKPENILMLNDVPKISDLGLSKIMKTSGVVTKSGTPFYLALEVYE